jgi:hypothetical protein
LVNAVEHQCVQVHLEIGRAAKTLDERIGAAGRLISADDGLLDSAPAPAGRARRVRDGGVGNGAGLQRLRAWVKYAIVFVAEIIYGVSL